MKEVEFGIITLGCPKNEVDSDKMRQLLMENGLKETRNPFESDVLIINTCTFIDEATQQSIETFFEADAERRNGQKILLTGCLVQRYGELLLCEMPECDGIVGLSEQMRLPLALKLALEGERPCMVSNFEKRNTWNEHVARPPQQGPWAYVKIAEGCDRRCAFCILPHIHGRYASRTPESVLQECRLLAENGAKEIILVSQDSGSYGKDLPDRMDLLRLLDLISQIEDVKRIRVMYLNPSTVTRELLREMAGNEKVCKYLDIPMQHASDKVLKSMGRPESKELLASLIEAAREQMPNVAIRSSFIIGYPTEGPDEFDELCDFIEKQQLDWVGFFEYSPQEKTQSASLRNPNKRSEVKRRLAEIAGIQAEIMRKKRSKLTGRKLDVLIESIGDKTAFPETDVEVEDGATEERPLLLLGRSQMEAPEVDGLIFVRAKRPHQAGDIVRALACGAHGPDIYAQET